MAASAAGKFVNALCALRGTAGRLNLGATQSCTLLQTRNYAARKGTREKARKKKVKHEVQKVGFIPHNLRGIKNSILPLAQIRPDDSWKPDIPSDDVYIGLYYKWTTYTFAEAIQNAKETHCPEMMDVPDAFIKVLVELDMTGPKPSKQVGRFSPIVAVPHKFDHGEKRSVAAFCKTPEMQEEAKKAGAILVGGQDLIARIQTGEIAVADFDHAVAHPDMMADMMVIKGLLKRKYPTPGNGSLGGNMPAMINKFLHGVKYVCHQHERQPLYGLAEAEFGRLDMDTKQLEENFVAIIDDIMTHRPKRAGEFITRLRLTSPPSRDLYKLNHELYTKGEKVKAPEDDDDDEEDEMTTKSAAANA